LRHREAFLRFDRVVLAAFADGDGFRIGRNGVDAPLIEPAYDAGPFESRRPIIAALRFNEA